MIADIQSRIDSLSKSKKAPKNLDKAKLESAKNGLDEVSKARDEANQAYKKGNLADAFENAKSAEKAGIERTRLHNLRHSAISLLLNSGSDPFAVQKLAGHSDVRLATQIYAHVRAAGVLLTG